MPRVEVCHLRASAMHHPARTLPRKIARVGRILRWFGEKEAARSTGRSEHEGQSTGGLRIRRVSSRSR